MLSFLFVSSRIILNHEKKGHKSILPRPSFLHDKWIVEGGDVMNCEILDTFSKGNSAT